MKEGVEGGGATALCKQIKEIQRGQMVQGIPSQEGRHSQSIQRKD